MEIHIIGHVVVGNRCAGDTCKGLLGNTLAKKALVYTSQGGKYDAEDLHGTGVVIGVLYTIPLGSMVAPHSTQGICGW